MLWWSRSSRKHSGRRLAKKWWIKRVSYRSSVIKPADLEEVELRDDDAEDDEGAGIAEKEMEKEGEEMMDVGGRTRKKPRAIQPTGRVVGVVKRNWRA